MKRHLCFLFAVFAVFSPVMALEPMLINGTEVGKNQFQEVVQIRTRNSSCTATVVGPNTIVTAAHCGKTGDTTVFRYKGRKYEAELTISPRYKTEGLDVAVAVTDEAIRDAKPFEIGGTLTKGIMVSLLGYGCTKHQKPDPEQDDGGDWGDIFDYFDDFFGKVASDDLIQDGKLRYGKAEVVQIKGMDAISYTEGGAALCFGDSGGPTLIESKKGRFLVGINSRGNIEDTNVSLRLDIPESRAFLSDFAESQGVDICGITGSCRLNSVGFRDTAL